MRGHFSHVSVKLITNETTASANPATPSHSVNFTGPTLSTEARLDHRSVVSLLASTGETLLWVLRLGTGTDCRCRGDRGLPGKQVVAVVVAWRRRQPLLTARSQPELAAVRRR